MKVLFLKGPGIHHKNEYALSQYKNISFYRINREDLDYLDLSQYDCVYSPSTAISAVKYPKIKFVFGPHFSVFPDENQMAIIRAPNAIYIQPSEWAAQAWFNRGITIKHVPFAVDINRFREVRPANERNQVFLYYKREECNVLHNDEILSNYQKEVNTMCNFQSENINNKKERLTIMSNYLLNEISFTVYLNQILLKYGIKYDEIKNEYYKDDSTSEYKLDYLFYSKTSYSLKYENVNEAINNLLKYQFNTAFKHTSSVMKRYIK